MKQIITTILEALNNKDQTICAMEEKTKEMLNNQRNLHTFMDNIKDEIRTANLLHGDRQPYYYFYSAVAHLKHEDNKSAKDDLANAIQGFQILGFKLNEALSEWLFGIIHFENGNTNRSQQACESAFTLLSSLIRDCEEKGNYNQAKIYKKHLKQVEKFSRGINSSKRKKALILRISYPSIQIRIPWVPIYETVRAGPNGMIWADPPPKNGMSVHTLEIDGNQYTLHSTTSIAHNANLIVNLVNSVDYGLAKVKGQSMNASKPIPIEEGDFVMFSSGWNEKQNAIVIASYTLSDREISTMVKKYMAKDKILVSETTDSSEDYSPIELTSEYCILGTVLVVAKPI